MAIYRKTSLISFEDNNGEFGLVPHGTSKFNSSWQGFMIFHDVFEHYFEGKHKFFQNEFMENIGGEICAMGHLAYYVNIGLNNERFKNNYYSIDNMIANTAINLVQGEIEGDSFEFGERLESRIPRKLQNGRNYLEGIISMTFDEIYKKLEEEENFDKIPYLKSFTRTKIENLYRQGWDMAEKLVPNNGHNLMEMIDFIQFFDKFCKINDQKYFYDCFKGIDFQIKKEGDCIEWRAELVSYYPSEIKSYKITPRNRKYPPSIEDLYIYEDEY